jgi:DNA-binding beta-propeller fold protein YncE
VQIDATSLTVTQRIPLDSEFASLAVSPAGIWVSTANSLLRLDPDSGQVLATVPLEPADGISLLSTDPNGQVIYVAQATGPAAATFLLSERDATTGALLAGRNDLPSAHGAVPSATESGVWVSHATGMRTAVELLQASDLATVATFTQPGSTSAGTNGSTATVSGGRLWITDDGGTSKQVSCVDPTTGQLLAERSFDASPFYGPVTFGSLVSTAGRVYLATSAGLAVLQPDPACA